MIKLISKTTILVTVLAAFAVIAVSQTPQKGGEDETGPYELVANWPLPMCGSGYTSGSVGGVWAEAPDHVFVFQRGCLPILDPPADGIIPRRNASNFSLAAEDKANWPRWDHVLTVYDRSGKLVESWDQHNSLFVRPHRVLMNPYDPEKSVWLVDDGAHSIYKFTHDGKKLLMTLGEFKKPGNDKTHFNRPTDIVWTPNGDFYVSDGYVNTRVVKFSKDGKYILEWGTPGTGPSQFNTVHGIAIDNQGRIYVCDRANSRIQVFDGNGKYIEEWKNIRYPYYIYMSKDQHLWIGDGYTNKILKYDLNGKLLSSWGTFGYFPGGIWGPHQFSVDSENNLYIADVHNGRVQKFRPKPGVNPQLLVGQR
jgi:sugar lactone lactonase YvrE